MLINIRSFSAHSGARVLHQMHKGLAKVGRRVLRGKLNSLQKWLQTGQNGQHNVMIQRGTRVSVPNWMGSSLHQK